MSLSRSALMLVAAIILLAIIGVWTGEPVAGVWRWPTVLLIIMVAWERLRLVPHFTLQRQIAPSLALGEVCGYNLIVSNRARSPLWLETQADYPDGIEGDNALQTWQLQGGETQVRRLSITPVKLGESALGTLYLKQLGVFGLCWWTRRIVDQVVFTVEPARLENTVPVPGLSDAGNRRTRFQAGGGVELLDLRDYRYGDSMRGIDWKATARRGKPIVRRFEREQRLEIAVLIDCGRGSRIHCERLDRLHHYANVTAKLAEFAALQGDRIGCLAYAQQVAGKAPVTGGIGAVRQIRELLARLSASREEANALNAALEVNRLLKRRGLVIFLTDMEQPEAASQLIQAGQLLAAKHQVLVASLEDAAITDSLKQAARQWQDPYRHFAALEYRRGRELTQSQLQRSGVAVTRAAARHLDLQVLAYYRDKRGRIGGA
jgi:uncharacterized protein (DUF58 family)